MISRTALTALLLVFASPLIAQQGGPALTRRPLPAVKTPSPPKIDGDLTDPAWQSAPRAEIFVDQQTGASPSDQTTAYILFDDKYVYVAFRCLDSKPEGIVARETIRDQHFLQRGHSDYSTEDFVEVDFDPFLTHNATDFAQFSVNALGTPSARITGGRGNKAEWKGDWEAAARKTAQGWDAEMRIPWAILNYPSGRRALTFGINFVRFQDRTKVQSVWSNIGPQSFQDLEGLWTGVETPAGGFRPHVSLLPYTMPGLDGSRPTWRSGLDARYVPTPELTAVASINPDFGTVEGAVEGIQFSRSEKFIPERRPFFLEGSDFFGSSRGFMGIGQYFYTQRIRTFDVGAKVYGKVTPVDAIGVLSTVDIGRRADFVGRYRHDLSPTSNVGAFVSQLSATDDNNTIGAANYNSRWGKFSAGTEIVGSSGQAAGGSVKSANVRFLDRTIEGELDYFDVAPNFRDAEGLINYTDYRGFSGYLQHMAKWRQGAWRSFYVSASPYYYLHSSGIPFRRGVFLDSEFETRSDWLFSFFMEYQKFEDQTDRVYNFRVRQGISNRYRQWDILVSGGTQADQPYSFVGPEFAIRTLRKLDVAYSGSFQSFAGQQQQHILTMNYEISPTRSIGGRLVVQNADTNWYLSYRNSGARGTEIFVILGDPNAGRYRQIAAIKFVFAI